MLSKILQVCASLASLTHGIHSTLHITLMPWSIDIVHIWERATYYHTSIWSLLWFPFYPIWVYTLLCGHNFLTQACHCIFSIVGSRVAAERTIHDTCTANIEIFKRNSFRNSNQSSLPELFISFFQKVILASSYLGSVLWWPTPLVRVLPQVEWQ